MSRIQNAKPNDESSPLGYDFGRATVAKSPISAGEWEQLKAAARFTEEDERWLALAGEVLSDQRREIVAHWRAGIIADIPHLAKHSRGINGESLPEYLHASNLRFEQWIHDTCLRPYDQTWLDYQHEIALRHTPAKKNKTDSVRSTAGIPFQDIIAFVATMNETIRPFLSSKGHPPEAVDKMHLAWQKSLQLQLAVWSRAFGENAAPLPESHC